MSEIAQDKQVRAARFGRFKDAVLRGPKQVARSIFGASGSLSSMYWALLDSAFGREHRAVLAGMRAYEAIEGAGAANRFMLRRNVHRIEKGLIMRPRRPIFGLGYIEDTVGAYERALRAHRDGELPVEDVRWAHDVLEEYFSVVASHPLVDALRARFEALPGIDPTDVRAVPYLRDPDAPSPVDFDAFRALTRRRRSVRWFAPRPVPHELIDKALEAAFEAPSACNRQPFVFRFFDDPERVRSIAEIPAGTGGFAHNIRTLCVIVGRLRAYPKPRDRHLIYIDASLAAMGFMLALETLGLSSCPLNWPDVASREQRLAELLGLEPDERPIMLIAVGYADPEGAVAFSQKQPLDSLRTYNE